MSVLRSAGVAILLLVVAQLLGQLVGCAALGEAFGVEQAVDSPHDTTEMFDCRLHSSADYGINKDAGGAWDMYESCMRDAGFR